MPNPKPWPRGPPFVYCPLLLTHYIHSYPPHLEIISTVCNLKTHHAMLTRDILNMPFLGVLSVCFVLCKMIISAVRRVKLVIVMVSYIIVRGYWCNIVVLNVHAPVEYRTDETKGQLLWGTRTFIWSISQGDFNPKICTADTFRPMIGNKRVNEISNDNEVRIVNFAALKSVIIRRGIFSHCSIHKFAWMSPNGKPQSRWPRFDRLETPFRCRRMDCDTTHCLVVAEVREELAISKWATQKLDLESFSLKKLDKAKVKNSIRLKCEAGSQLWKT